MLRRLLILCVSVLPISLFADANIYLWEVGIHGGAGYYIGELTPYKLSTGLDVLSYGAHARRKFDERWAVQGKAITQRVAGKNQTDSCSNQVWNVDITADFNFFDFGERDFNIKQVSPYIFAGVGCAMFTCDSTMTASPYIPIGIGIKWKFHDRMQLQLAWQHNIHVWNGDCLEGFSDKFPEQQDAKQKNFMNNDVTSTITAAFIVEFAKPRYKYQNIRY
jgi:hypothetical protein